MYHSAFTRPAHALAALIHPAEVGLGVGLFSAFLWPIRPSCRSSLPCRSRTSSRGWSGATMPAFAAFVYHSTAFLSSCLTPLPFSYIHAGLNLPVEFPVRPTSCKEPPPSPDPAPRPAVLVHHSRLIKGARVACLPPRCATRRLSCSPAPRLPPFFIEASWSERSESCSAAAVYHLTASASSAASVPGVVHQAEVVLSVHVAVARLLRMLVSAWSNSPATTPAELEIIVFLVKFLSILVQSNGLPVQLCFLPR